MLIDFSIFGSLDIVAYYLYTRCVLIKMIKWWISVKDFYKYDIFVLIT